ncbi:MAG: HXXEE domain-containing protein [Sphingopyxis sp.]
MTFRTLSFLLIVVIAAHNFEEWLTFPHFGEIMSLVRAKVGLSMAAPPPWPVMQMALILVTVLPALIILWANTGRANAVKTWLICWTASIFLANVFIPHIPASFILGGYSPGVLTAVLVNLPFCMLLLMKARTEKLLTGMQLAAAVGAGFLTLPMALAAVFAISSAFIL